MTDARDVAERAAGLRAHEAQATEALTAIADTLNAELERMPDDVLLMQMLDMAADASELIAEFRDALEALERRR